MIGAALMMSAPAWASECDDASWSYINTKNDVGVELVRYTRCITENNFDDCSYEFGRIKTKQAALESTMTGIEVICADEDRLVKEKAAARRGLPTSGE
jgi:hypothetical protein